MAHATIHPETSLLHDRVVQLSERLRDERLARVAAHTSPVDSRPLANEQEHRDWLSTCLMDAFKTTGDQEAFALLFELNAGDFLRTIRARLRHCSGVDANDVLQDAFVNMYRYPSRFDASQKDAFRNWGHRVVRNTMFASIKGAHRQPQARIDEDESVPQEDTRTSAPERVAEDREIAATVDNAWLLFLSLYLVQFERLNPKEQRALTMVEVEDATYRETADEIGVCVANLKMVIFRARRRILRGMAESLAALDRCERIVGTPLSAAG